MKTHKVIFALALLIGVVPLHAQATREAAEFPDVPNENPISLTTVATPDVNSLTTTLSDVFAPSGAVPLSIEAGSLDTSWRTFKPSYNELYDATALFYAGGSSAYFTKGQTLSINGETYLVTYRAERAKIDVSTFTFSGSNPPKPLPLLRTTKLLLSLLSVKTVGNFSEIKPFDPSTVLSTKDAVVAANIASLRAVSNSNLQSLALAMHEWLQEYDDEFPPMQNMAAFKKAISPYVRNESAFKQPDTQKFYAVNPILSNKQLAHISNLSQLAAIYESQIGTDGKRAVAFADGHVKRVSESEWTKIKKVSRIK